MDFLRRPVHSNSELIDPEVAGKVCKTKFPVRRSLYRDLAIQGEVQMSREWYDAGGDSFWGGTSPVGNSISLALPETEAERVQPMVRLTEILFFIDNEIEALPTKEVDAFTNDFYQVSNPDYKRSAPQYKRSTVPVSNGAKPGRSSVSDAKRQLLAKVLLEFCEVDRKRSQQVVDLMEEYAGVQSRPHPADESWDDFVHNRWKDNALRVYCGFLIFAMGLNLTQEQIDGVDDITRPACYSILLTNDVTSYDKEIDQVVPGEALLNNGVACMMKERHLDAAATKKILLEETIPAFEQVFLDRFRAFMASSDPRKSEDMVRCLEAVGFMAGGNAYWSSACLRYHNYRKARTLPAPSSSQKDLSRSLVTNGTKPQICTLLASLTPETGLGVIKASTNGNVGLVPCDGPVDEIVLEPSEYLRSLPSKGIRGQMLRALNVWLLVPEPTLERIERLIGHLHESSLLLDDIEDNSRLRRGFPTTHLIYGQSQTINGANYLYVLALEELLGLENPDCREIYLEELQQNICPTVPEYMEMIANKTGGLFCMLGLLMAAEGTSDRPIPTDDLRTLMKLLGQYYQIRDDYQNLASAEYEAQKGFAEDLDEGKFTLPLLHALQHSGPAPNRLRLRNILQQRARQGGGMSIEMKKAVLDILEEVRSLDFVRQVLAAMEEEVYGVIGKLEEKTGEVNYILRMIFERLRVE